MSKRGAHAPCLAMCIRVYNVRRPHKDLSSEEFVFGVEPVIEISLSDSTPKTNSSELRSLSGCLTLYVYGRIQTMLYCMPCKMPLCYYEYRTEARTETGTTCLQSSKDRKYQKWQDRNNLSYSVSDLFNFSQKCRIEMLK